MTFATNSPKRKRDHSSSFWASSIVNWDPGKGTGEGAFAKCWISIWFTVLFGCRWRGLIIYRTLSEGVWALLKCQSRAVTVTTQKKKSQLQKHAKFQAKSLIWNNQDRENGRPQVPFNKPLKRLGKHNTLRGAALLFTVKAWATLGHLNKDRGQGHVQGWDHGGTGLSWNLIGH